MGLETVRTFKCLFSFALTITLLLSFSCTPSNSRTVPSTSSSPSPTITSPPPTPSKISVIPGTTIPGVILEFENFPIYGNLKDQNIPSQIHVMVNIESPLPDVIKDITMESQAKLSTLDFSRYFILFVFMGFQSVTGPYIKVKQIWQVKDTIWVQADFNPDGPTYLPTYSSPFQDVKVNKENITQFGEITFRLLDLSGKERATTTCEIPQ
jgi:hypothetical protein